MAQRTKPSRHVYYLTDDVTFQGRFNVDGVAQTPDADTAKALVMKKGESDATVEEIAATIVGTTISYKYTNVALGDYALFLYAKFSNGADERTGRIDFTVVSKRRH